MSKQPTPSPCPLYKQRSWTPDTEREEAWLRRKGNRPITPVSRSKSLTDEDLQELKGCIELGFGFGHDSPDLDPRLSDALPALSLYCAVNKQYNNVLNLTRSSSLSSTSSDGSIIDPDDDPEMVKTRLRQWAQAVACSVKQFSGEPS
ncbi:hypothetical protein HS088_TW02G00213 [Tripterygium wilfordii]|uniref:Membrane insertase YidC n=1 Tax=Tripterygium wilfordii TaxID=458696 RepID=A0A7J7DY03_TRIWF|nr:uncharacterized protein LOC120016928 [Tripterygium wilfordii]KAF5751203.1 hypothetical protein HS088_TW02G00213 [Tripterygium wilfordii]